MRITLFLGLLLIPSFVFAHAPVREASQTATRGGSAEVAIESILLEDPSDQSIAAYGSLDEPGEVDVYSFTIKSDETIPVEVLVPVRISNSLFHPTAVVVHSAFERSDKPYPFDLPEGYGDVSIPAPVMNEREVFFEPFSQERLYHGNEQMISTSADETYYIFIFDERGQTGDYSLGIGTVENFEDQKMIDILKEVLLIKFGLVSSSEIPWGDVIGLFLVLAGFIIGLGAVTVIDIHGFLGRKSSYWTQTTIRTHKVTKPLIWIGISLVLLGGSIFYQSIGWTGLVPIQLLMVGILILNGLFLTFVVSPFLLEQEKKKKDTQLLPKSLQAQITISFIVSFLGWWMLLSTLVWHLLVLR